MSSPIATYPPALQIFQHPPTDRGQPPRPTCSPANARTLRMRPRSITSHLELIIVGEPRLSANQRKRIAPMLSGDQGQALLVVEVTIAFTVTVPARARAAAPLNTIGGGLQ